MDFGFFRERTPKQIFFGSLGDFSENEIDNIVRLCLDDVVKYLFHKIPDNMRIKVPNEIPQVLNKLYESEIIRYYQAGKYFVFESANREEEKVEFMNSILNNLKNDRIGTIPPDLVFLEEDSNRSHIKIQLGTT